VRRRAAHLQPQPRLYLVLSSERRKIEKAGVPVVGILWAIVVILVIIWLIGLIAHIAGGLIYIALVIAVIIAAYNLLTGRRGV
jgi:hypothetical protein